MVNPDKHQATVLGANSKYEFAFPIKNSIDSIGVTIDKDLSFNRHISQICECNSYASKGCILRRQRSKT